jgi:hypothetical protein
MTTTPKDGGPAFPVMHSIDGNWVTSPREEYMGLSLRDWFAGQALAGVAEAVIEGMAENGPHAPYADIAWVCYQIADAMLALRETDND